MTDVEQKLKAEIEAHQRTKVEFEKYRMDHAFHEYENGNKNVQIFINKLQAENAAQKIEIVKMKHVIKELNAQLLPANKNLNGGQRLYEFRRTK